MTVTLTSPVLGQDVGTTYTGPIEAWLLAEGYARQDGYVGPGVSNTGVADTTPANDLTLASNRELEPKRNADGSVDPGRLDPALTPLVAPDPIRPAFDFDPGGVDNDPPSNVTLTPVTGPALKAGAVVGSAAAVAIVTGGNLVLSINGAANVTVALLAADTPAAVVTKINTGIGAAGTASLASGALRIESATTGAASSVTIVSGTGTVLANLFLTAGQAGSGQAGGGTVVTIAGDNLTGVTSVTFGGGAGTALNTANATRGQGGSMTVTTPAVVAGAKDVVLVDASGNLTLTNGFTYV